MSKKISGEAILISLRKDFSSPLIPSLVYLIDEREVPSPFSDDNGKTNVFFYQIVGVKETSGKFFLEIFCHMDDEQEVETLFKDSNLENSPHFYSLEIAEHLVPIIIGMFSVDESFYIYLFDKEYKNLIVESGVLDESTVPLGVVGIPRLDFIHDMEDEDLDNPALEISEDELFSILARSRLNESLRDIVAPSYYDDYGYGDEEYAYRETQSALFQILFNLKEGNILEGWERLGDFIASHIEENEEVLKAVFRFIYLQSTPSVRFSSDQGSLESHDSEDIEVTFNEIVESNNLGDIVNTLSGEEYLKPVEGGIVGDDLNLSYPFDGQIPESIKIILKTVKETDPEILDLINLDYVDDNAWDYALEQYGLEKILKATALIITARLILISATAHGRVTPDLIKIMSLGDDYYPWELVPISVMLANYEDKPLIELFEMKDGDGPVSGYLVVLLSTTYYKIIEEGWNLENCKERLAEYSSLSNTKINPSVSQILESLVRAIDSTQDEDGEFIVDILTEGDSKTVSKNISELLFTLGDYHARKTTEELNSKPREIAFFRERYLKELFEDASMVFSRRLS